jgi:hypothetical protein
LFVDGVPVAATYDPITGTLTPTDPLGEGSHDLAYGWSDAAGNVSMPSAEVTVNIDTTAPAAPTISPTVAGNTDDTTPSLGIPAPPAGTTAVLFVDGVPVPATYDPITGTLTPTDPLSEGAHDLAYGWSDAAGNVSMPSAEVTVNIDTTPPAAPTTPPAVASDTDDTTPGLGIPAPPAGVAAVLFVDGVPVPATYDPITGMLTPTDPLSEGTHEVAYGWRDAAGNVSTPSPDVTVNIDTVAPVAPSIPPTAQSDTNDTTPSLNVPAPPAGTTAVLFIDGVPVPATYDPITGTLTPTDPLSEGAHDLAYGWSDAAGNVSMPSPEVTINIDTTSPAAPTIPPAAASDTDDTTPGVGVPAPPAGTTAVLFVDGVPVPATYDPITGTLTPTDPLGEGSHDLAYGWSDAAGNVSMPSAEVTVNIDTTPPAAPTTPPAVASDTDDTTPGLGIPAPPAGIAAVLFVDGVPVPATYDPITGMLTPNNPLGEGSHDFAYGWSDAAGNVSMPSPDVSVNIDTIAPVAPSIPPTAQSDTNDTTPSLNVPTPPPATSRCRAPTRRSTSTRPRRRRRRWRSPPTPAPAAATGSPTTAR